MELKRENTLLIVDDARDVHELIRHYLREYDCQILSAYTTSEALLILDNQHVDLILLDILIGRDDGRDLLQKIRQTHSSVLLPVIIVTAMQRSADVAASLQAGANDYLRKPFAKSELVARVETQLDLSLASQQLAASKSQFQRIVENLPEIVYTVEYQDHQLIFTYVSPAIFSLTGFTVEQFLADPDQLVELGYGSWRNHFRNLAITEEDSLISRWLTRHSHIIWTENKAVVLRDEHGHIQKIEGVIRDITRHKAYDPLTGLANRELLLESIELQLQHESASDLSLVMIGLKNFKMYNESIGHQLAESLLIESANRLRITLNNSRQALLARVGESQFAISVIHKQAQESIMDLALTLQDAFLETIAIENQNLLIALQIGIAHSSSELGSSRELFEAASMALSNGESHNQSLPVLYRDDLRETARRAVALQSNLHIAMRENQFRMFGQPILDNLTGKIRKVELLLRWEHPEQGLIAPDAFVPQLEKTGLIRPLGYWIMEQASQLLIDLSAHGLDTSDFVIALNFSANQLDEPDLAGRLERILLDHSVNPAQFEIELTETLLFGSNTGKNLLSLESLREIGLRIALDDFGTGYSSLSYLRYIPINTLKIDRSFVMNIENRDKSLAILKAIVTLARELQLNIVAEGVENEAQYQILKALGCQYLQGYWIERPMPLPDLIQFIADFNSGRHSRAQGIQHQQSRPANP
ncbi:MAG: EAL domain-containing protein [Leptospiraceae bacterium]|nr:EAL domain-containing protein [Leptospiraceae bacterium]